MYGLAMDAAATLYGSEGRGRSRGERAAERLTPTADTNEPGFRRMPADQRKR
jgi:hypothetical protein